MMRVLVLALLFAFTASVGNAQQHLSDEVQMDAMSRGDKRFVQALLSIAGDYSGRINGRWEEASQKALGRYAARKTPLGRMTWRAIAKASRKFESDLSNGGWEPYYDDATNMSFQLPLSILQHRSGDNETLWFETNGDLVIRTRTDSPQATEDLHQWVVDSSAQNSALIRKKNGNRMITSGQLKNQVDTMYVRSHRRDGQYSTTSLQWSAEKLPVARLIIASIVMGGQNPLEISENGLLHQAIKVLEREETGQPTEPEPQQPVPYVGTGFYINNTDIVTANSVKDSCRELRLEDGTILKPIRQNPQHGLAVLTSPMRSTHWLALNPDNQTEPGQTLASAAITHRDNALRHLVPLKGQVMGKMELGNRGLRLTVSMRQRSGNTGAPVFDSQNRVVGVMTNGPDGNDGQLAFFTPVSFLTGILERQNILFDRQSGDDGRPDNNVFQSEAAQAIVPLYCK